MTRKSLPATRGELERLLRYLLAAELGVEPSEITLEADVSAALDTDSLTQVGVAMAIEDELDLEIPDAVLDRVFSLGDLVSYLGDRLGLPT